MATRAQISVVFNVCLNTMKSTATLTHCCAFLIVVKLATDSTCIAFMDVKMFTVNKRVHGIHDTVSAMRSSVCTTPSDNPINIVPRFCKINITHAESQQVAAALFERIMIIEDNANAKHDNVIDRLCNVSSYETQLCIQVQSLFYVNGLEGKCRLRGDVG
jgi:hypothetical protein